GVQMNETAQDAVLREVFEETGVHYEIDRLAVIHENFWQGGGVYDKGLNCHELALYFLMKPRGTKQLQSSSRTRFGDREKMHWVPVNELHTVKHFPAFLQGYLQAMPQQTVHIVQRENA
ncbi:MAG: NUDIX domain-containing protein, partial [Oscillospiraceae bacterium]|nr:NUDIX domain-containing protein [Oscillospiraceae bacterium]